MFLFSEREFFCYGFNSLRQLAFSVLFWYWLMKLAECPPRVRGSSNTDYGYLKVEMTIYLFILLLILLFTLLEVNGAANLLSWDLSNIEFD
jgi:hypothetical protein